MHIYAFGSICRGDVSLESDVDLLAIVEGNDPRFDPDVYSIYSYKRIQELWGAGNPFAWHLSLESRLLHSSDQSEYLKGLGAPKPYKECVHDCEKFLAVFHEAYSSIAAGKSSIVFDLSTIFLSIRNLATCFSLGVMNRPDFSRNSALRLGTRSIPLSQDSYRFLERARILCTRGRGSRIQADEISVTVKRLNGVAQWMSSLIDEAKQYERIQ